MAEDRELLEQVYLFLHERDFVLGDEGSVRDMVNRYARPPLTLRNRACMQLTIQEYKMLAIILVTIGKHLYPEKFIEESSSDAI